MIAYLHYEPRMSIPSPRLYRAILNHCALRFRGRSWWGAWWWFNVYRWLGMCGVALTERIRITTRWEEV